MSLKPDAFLKFDFYSPCFVDGKPGCPEWAARLSVFLHFFSLSTDIVWVFLDSFNIFSFLFVFSLKVSVFIDSAKKKVDTFVHH